MLRKTDEEFKRMLAERDELKERIEKLDKFAIECRHSGHENVTLDEIHLMEEQLAPMREYLGILEIRIYRVKE